MRIELSNDDKNIIETALVLAHSMVGTINNDYIEMYDKMRAMPSDGPGIAELAIEPIPEDATCMTRCPICSTLVLGCCERHAIDNLKLHAKISHRATMEVA